jgi:hypothetical protein
LHSKDRVQCRAPEAAGHSCRPARLSAGKARNRHDGASSATIAPETTIGPHGFEAREAVPPPATEQPAIRCRTQRQMVMRIAAAYPLRDHTCRCCRSTACLKRLRQVQGHSACRNSRSRRSPSSLPVLPQAGKNARSALNQAETSYRAHPIVIIKCSVNGLQQKIAKLRVL